LIIGKRSSIQNRKPEDYLPCSFCYIFFIKTELYKHAKKCSHKPEIRMASDNEDEEDSYVVKTRHIKLAQVFLASALNPVERFVSTSSIFRESATNKMHDIETTRILKSNRVVSRTNIRKTRVYQFLYLNYQFRFLILAFYSFTNNLKLLTYV